MTPRAIQLRYRYLGTAAQNGDLSERHPNLCADAGTPEIVNQLILQPLNEGVG